MPTKCFYATDTKCWGYKVNKSRHDPGPHGIYSLELEININQISFTVLITHMDKHLQLCKCYEGKITSATRGWY